MRRRLLGAALAAVLLLGVAAWGTGVARKAFNYDEVEHAHAAWLVAQGDTPYHDFFECHPPFAWYVMAALDGVLPEGPGRLFAWRIGTGLASALALLLLMMNVRLRRPEVTPAWAVAAVALVAWPSQVMDYLVEARLDSWALALLLGALLLVRGERPRWTFDRYLLFAFLASWSLLISPKLVLLPALFGVADLLTLLRRPRRLLAAALGHAAGVSAALWLAWGLLLLLGIDPLGAVGISIRYHALYNERAGFEGGLLGSVLLFPGLIGVVGLGLLAWLSRLAATLTRPDPFELALVGLLAAQLVLVAPPYKQYYAPWFLLAAGLVPFVGPALKTAMPRLGALALPVVLLAAGAQGALSIRHYARQQGAPALASLHRHLLAITPARARVAVPPPFHPVERRDTFYGWVRTIDPKGYGTEPLMRELALTPFSARFERAWYERELAERPPAVVALDPRGRLAFSPDQNRALAAFLRASGERYVLVRGGPVPFLVEKGGR